MADTTNKLIGQNYTTPDLVAKVTGKAKYAEDYKVDGMLWTKLMLSPMPHARITRLDLSAALAMPGVKAILTADDLPEAQAGGTLGENVQASTQGERILTKEPVYEGEPILAVAAVDELTAAEAIEKIVSNTSRCRSLSIRSSVSVLAVRTRARRATRGMRRTGGAPAAAGRSRCGLRAPQPVRQLRPPALRYRSGAVAPPAGAAPAAAALRQARRHALQAPQARAPAAGRGSGRGGSRAGGSGRRRWSRRCGSCGRPWRGSSRASGDPDLEVGTGRLRRGDQSGHMPTGKPAPGSEWTWGNIEEGFKKADLVLEETFVSQSTGHQPLETRSAMAYWQNGKLFLHGSTQSTVQTIGAIARWVGIPPAQVVLISEYTGGGFGSKIPGAISMAIPALLSKKANAPVMMRIAREEEHYIGRARAGVHSRVKVGFRKDGKITAIDLFTVGDNGPYEAQGDYRSAANTVSLCYQPKTMRWRGITVLTNTPAAHVAARAGRHAGQRPDGAGDRQGRAQARHRRGGDSQDQRPGRQGAIRSRRRARQAGVRHEFVREGSARQGRRALQLGREEGAQRQARGQRRFVVPAWRSARSRAARPASTGCSSSSPTAACSSSRASATTARTRSSTCIASPPR